MVFKLSADVADAMLDAFEPAIGADAILKIFTGSPPANCAAADSGTVLATLELPTDWMGAASGGSLAKAGTWSDSAADDNGEAGHFRLYATDGTTCGAQGTVTETGGGGDMTVDNTSFATGQAFTITGFTLTMSV